MNPVWKLNCFLFNIEGYGEFFSGIAPQIKATEVWLVATSAGHLKYWRYGKTREFRVKLNFAPKNSPTFYPELLFDCIYCIVPNGLCRIGILQVIFDRMVMILYRTYNSFSLFAMQLDYCNIQRVFEQN